jgi:LPS-assembly protein
MSKQGLLLRAEWRQRLDSGYYSIRLAGIQQLDKEYFREEYGETYPGYRDFRGSVETRGHFAITDKWQWGWDGILPTDSTFYSDYGLSSYQRSQSQILTGLTEGINQVYLVGKGNRSYFDIRSIYYYGFSVADVQNQIPVIHPVTDYFYTFERPVLGGELGFRTNLTSLSRKSVSFDQIVTTAVLPDPSVPAGTVTTTNPCGPSTDPRFKIPAFCLLRGVPGNYSRFSAESVWKRTITDPFGQQFTPFAYLRTDVAALSIDPQPGVSNYLTPGDRSEFRFMPTAGVEYRYPFISVQSWGTQTITPIAQVIVRPDEPSIGKLPNEDAQSLIFDDSNLFKINKFSGWDRIEGGGRANVGLQYTAQFNNAGFLDALFGQSYQLFGLNSFAVGDATNTGLGSGLDTNASDYVARLSYRPDRTYMFTTRFRFDQADWSMNRFELEGRATYDRVSLAVVYGQYAPQPELGFLTWRQSVRPSINFKLGTNWRATGILDYDIDAAKFSATEFGLGYIDDCFIFAMSYATGYTYGYNRELGIFTGGQTLDHRFRLTIALRTLGFTGTTQTVSGLTGQQ